jgi:hypothetical protein
MLGPGQVLTSANGRYLAEMQTDGNVVVYACPSTPGSGASCPAGWRATWASGTDRACGAGAGCYLVTQTDGNLVVYRPGAPARPVWQSATSGHGAYPTYLSMQGDGNLVLSQGPTSPFAISSPLWATGTS